MVAPDYGSNVTGDLESDNISIKEASSMDEDSHEALKLLVAGKSIGLHVESKPKNLCMLAESILNRQNSE